MLTSTVNVYMFAILFQWENEFWEKRDIKNLETEKKIIDLADFFAQLKTGVQKKIPRV